MKRSLFCVLIGCLAFVSLPAQSAFGGGEIFSVNFYYTPWPWSPEDTHNITLEDGDQAAGVGDWLTNGWQDIEIPWAPTAPQDPETITGTKGATATFTLTAARNGGSYSWDVVRTTLLGDGNGDMMDGHANGTEDEDKLIEMTVSDIPFKNYDVMVYLGSQSAQFGDGTGKIFFNGVEQSFTLIGGAFDGTFAEIVDAVTPGNYILYQGLKDASFTIVVRGNGFNHIGPCGLQIRKASPELASSASPANEATDVLRDSDLSWSPGIFAATHNVYVGESFEAVDTATVPTAAGLDVTSYDPGRLEFDKTYYWRVDEVNGTPDRTVFKGEVWGFEVEPYSVMIPVDVNKVTASSYTGQNTPAMTVNGSGLDGRTHSENGDTMWLSTPGDLSPWLMVEFGQVQKLDKMLVWNSNGKSEAFIGWGIKDVNIETSLDGVDWTSLADAVQISQAPGKAGYDTPQTIDLGLAQAKYVRLNILSNWGGFLQQYGVSEMQFYGLPVQARTPDPASGAVDVLPNAVATWRMGREADQHTIYASTDANAVADGSAPSVSSTTNSLDLGSFDLQLGQTYYWRVDEVNEALAPFVWTGDIWNLTTVPYVTVDDFESYGNFSPNRPFQTWHDGYGYSADDFFPVDYAGNGTGAGIGHDIWTMTSPYFDGSIMETERTMAGSRQSMPFYYSNTGGVASETQRSFSAPQDWTVGGVQLLSIAFFGEAGNTGTLYAKINGTKVTYSLEPTHISAQSWKTWNIDLSTLGINLQSVTTLAIGVEGNGASGMLLLDDIVLRRAPSGPAETVSLINDFDSLPVGSSMDAVPGWEGWFGDAQWAGNITDTVAYSGTKSLEIVGTRDDVVPNWPKVESGVYVASVMQYVPTGTDGSMYFGPLSSYGSTWDDTAWLGTLLTNCTTDRVYINELDAGTRTEATLLRDQWVELKIVMNFGGNACDFYYGDTLLGSLECPSAMGFDMWPDDDVDVIYFDDFRFQSQTDYLLGFPITVPNGDFEAIYQPGSNMITADLGEGWTQGVGPDTLMDDGTATFSDGTTGDLIDIPGWIGADAQGWVDNGGTYDRDTSFPNRQGAVTRQSDTPDGLYYFLSNGGAWGNAAGGLIVSEAPVAMIESGRTYVLSMLANGGATPLVLELLADGVALTPSDSVDPALSDDWQTFSRTYDAADLQGLVGASLTIRLGVGRGASGGQSHFDAVLLYKR